MPDTPPKPSIFTRLHRDAERYSKNRDILKQRNYEIVKSKCSFKPKVCRGTKTICNKLHKSLPVVFDRLTVGDGRFVQDIKCRDKVAVESFRCAFENEISTETRNIFRNAIRYKADPRRRSVVQEISPSFKPSLNLETQKLTRWRQPNVYKRLSHPRDHTHDLGIHQYLKEVEERFRYAPEINDKITKRILANKRRGKV